MTSTIRGSDNFDSSNKLTAGTAQNTTSGTAIDFTGIPSWAKRITLSFNSVSTNGTTSLLVQVGSGSVSSSGYSAVSTQVSGTVGNSTAGVLSSVGFILYHNSALNVFSGSLVLTLVSNNTWVCSSTLYQSTGAYTGSCMSSGLAPTLVGALDRVRITTTSGTDLFDAGSVNILYE